MGLFDFFKSGKKPAETSLKGFVRDEAGNQYAGNLQGTVLDPDKGKEMTFEEANQLREKFLAATQQDSESQAFNRASGLMLQKSFAQSIAAYQVLAEQYPERKATCESQIGAAYYFLQDYDQAITYYVAARENGEDASMMDDNIWEACETAYKKTNDIAFIQKYKDLCPNGSYLKKANKITG